MRMQNKRGKIFLSELNSAMFLSIPMKLRVLFIYLSEARQDILRRPSGTGGHTTLTEFYRFVFFSAPLKKTTLRYLTVIDNVLHCWGKI